MGENQLSQGPDLFRQKQDRLYTYKRSNAASSCNIRCRGQATRITHSECVFVPLATHHAKRMYRIILPLSACLPVPCFYT
jgi:hypothetical protein